MTDRLRNVKNERLPIILDAAELEFAQKGYDGTSIPAIAERAGLTRRKINHYFKTKDKLYSEVIERIFREWEFINLLERDGDPKQIFSDYIEERLLSSKNKPQRYNLILQEMMRGGPVLLRKMRAEKADKIMAQYKKGYEHRMESNQFTKVDPLQYIFVLWAVFSFYTSFEPQVAFMMGRKKITDSDWNHIITQAKHILLAIFDSHEPG